MAPLHKQSFHYLESSIIREIELLSRKTTLFHTFLFAQIPALISVTRRLVNYKQLPSKAILRPLKVS